MSHRLEMIEAARRAPGLLGDSRELVCRFIDRQWNPDGGCKNRGGQSDLYYTVFGLNSAISLRTPFPSPSIAQYLSGFGGGERLDLVHLACLVRCWASLRTGDSETPAMPDDADSALQREILARIERHRSRDGGYAPVRGALQGTAYATFLALGAYEDGNTPMPDAFRALEFLRDLRLPDGAWSHDRSISQASTPITAAAVTVLHRLRCPTDGLAMDFLRGMFHPMGGFFANPMAPVPDLLSTATALDALDGAGVDLSPMRERCLDFIDTLWSNEGAFYAHWQDDALDSEYVFYGLLALGKLS
jgi:hypothetical protein